MTKLINSTAAAITLGIICASLSGCVSDAGTASSNVSQKAGDSAPLRYYGGPKYPMWPAAH